STQSSAPHRRLHSFPTRRSSDLPTPERVARRALALAAVTARALLEQQDSADPRGEANRQRFLSWVAALGLEDELEPDEWEVLQRDRKSTRLNSSHRTSSYAVFCL